MWAIKNTKYIDIQLCLHSSEIFAERKFEKFLSFKFDKIRKVKGISAGAYSFLQELNKLRYKNCGN